MDQRNPSWLNHLPRTISHPLPRNLSPMKMTPIAIPTVLLMCCAENPQSTTPPYIDTRQLHQGPGLMAEPVPSDLDPEENPVRSEIVERGQGNLPGVHRCVWIGTARNLPGPCHMGFRSRGIAFRRSLEVWRSQGAAFFSAPRSLRIALVRTFSTPGSTSEAMALAS